MAVGFYMGWLMACALLVLVPFMGVIGWLMEAMMGDQIKKSLVAYS